MVFAVDGTPDANNERAFGTLPSIPLLFGGRNRPYPVPHRQRRHNRIVPIDAGEGMQALSARPVAITITPADDDSVPLMRPASLPASGATTTTASGHAVKMKADSSTP